MNVDQSVVTEFDAKCAAWVRAHVPDANPVLGTVRFVYDEFGCDTCGGWSRVYAEWDDREEIQPRVWVYRRKHHVLGGDGERKFDLGAVIRELVEIEPAD